MSPHLLGSSSKIDEIPDGGGKLVEAQGRRIALLRSGDRYYVLDNTCTQKGGPRPPAEGSIDAGLLAKTFQWLSARTKTYFS